MIQRSSDEDELLYDRKWFLIRTFVYFKFKLADNVRKAFNSIAGSESFQNLVF